MSRYRIELEGEAKMKHQTNTEEVFYDSIDKLDCYGLDDKEIEIVDIEFDEEYDYVLFNGYMYLNSSNEDDAKETFYDTFESFKDDNIKITSNKLVDIENLDDYDFDEEY